MMMYYYARTIFNIPPHSLSGANTVSGSRPAKYFLKMLARGDDASTAPSFGKEKRHENTKVETDFRVS
jgi:hypothetical protein